MAGGLGGLQVGFVKSTSKGKLFSSEQTQSVAASCSSAPAEDSRGWLFSPAWATGLTGGSEGLVSLQWMFCCSSSLQLPSRGRNGVSVDTLSSALLLCSPGAQGRLLWRGCTSQRVGGWQEVSCLGSWCWSENAATSTSFASRMRLQEFAVLASHGNEQGLSLTAEGQSQLHPTEPTPGDTL